MIQVTSLYVDKEGRIKFQNRWPANTDIKTVQEEADRLCSLPGCIKEGQYLDFTGRLFVQTCNNGIQEMLIIEELDR